MGILSWFLIIHNIFSSNRYRSQERYHNQHGDFPKAAASETTQWQHAIFHS